MLNCIHDTINYIEDHIDSSLEIDERAVFFLIIFDRPVYRAIFMTLGSFLTFAFLNSKVNLKIIRINYSHYIEVIGFFSYNGQWGKNNFFH